MKIFIGSIILGLAIYYLISFRLIPYINSFIPQGEWATLAKIGIYFLIGTLGGVGIPLVIIFFGFVWWKES